MVVVIALFKCLHPGLEPQRIDVNKKLGKSSLTRKQTEKSKNLKYPRIAKCMVKGLIEQQPIGTPSTTTLGGALANQPIARAHFAPIAPKNAAYVTLVSFGHHELLRVYYQLLNIILDVCFFNDSKVVYIHIIL